MGQNQKTQEQIHQRPYNKIINLNMNMKYLRLQFLLTLLSILLFGCVGAATVTQDPFYQEGSEWDHLQFPLIKPYYAIYIAHSKFGWGIPLMADPPSEATYYYYQLHEVQKIAVENDVIMVYTPYEENVDKSQGQKVLYWFVFVPAKNIEMGFDKEAEFLTYLKQYNIQQPLWQKPGNLSQQFDETGCLKWIPNCK